MTNQHLGETWKPEKDGNFDDVMETGYEYDQLTTDLDGVRPDKLDEIFPALPTEAKEELDDKYQDTFKDQITHFSTNQN